MIKKILNKETILYLIFGFCTTILNIIVYKGLTLLSIDYLVSTILAWFISVVFAFITNKIFVFENHNKKFLSLFAQFFSSRILTGGLDVFIMFISVDILCFNDFIVKIISNILIIIINYLLSKIFIFKKDTP